MKKCSKKLLNSGKKWKKNQNYIRNEDYIRRCLKEHIQLKIRKEHRGEGKRSERMKMRSREN